MSEELIVRLCAPTLAGIKTGNIFSCAHEGKTKLYAELRKINKRIASKGIRVVPLSISEEKALIYLYRPEILKRDFSNEAMCKLLSEFGYSAEQPDCCVCELCKKFRQKQDFPHEVGLFISYPPEDVAGFIENKARNEKFTGFWKVYGDENKAKKTFAKYRKCTEVYCEHMAKGRSLEWLTVAV